MIGRATLGVCAAAVLLVVAVPGGEAHARNDARDIVGASSTPSVLLGAADGSGVSAGLTTEELLGFCDDLLGT